MSAVFDHNALKVARSCPTRWREMEGDERVRFCQQCQKHVYNLSTMTKAEVEQLVTEKEGRFCGRMYRRKDGTVLTADCPLGIDTKWLSWFPWLMGAVSLVFVGLLVFFGGGCQTQGEMWPDPGAEIGKELPVPVSTDTQEEID